MDADTLPESFPEAEVDAEGEEEPSMENQTASVFTPRDNERSSSGNGSSSSERVRSQRREYRGRFAASGTVNTKKVRRVEQQRRHVRKKDKVRERIFSEYLASCFLVGNVGHSLPASRSNGAFMVMFQKVVKSDYQLGPNRRFAEMKRYFTEGCHLHSIGSAIPDLPAKLIFYPGSRMPLLKYKHEMRRVLEWLRILEDEKALRQESVSEAYEICKEILRQGNGGSGVVQLPHSDPDTQVRQSSPNSGVRNLEFEQRSQPEDLQQEDGTTQNRHSEDGGLSGGDGSSRSRVDLRNALDSNSNSSDPNPTLWMPEEEISKSRRVNSLFRIARNEEIYTMVHLALQEGCDWEFGLFSSYCLDEWRKKNIDPPDVVKRTLAYVRSKRLGVQNNEQSELERRLRITAEMLDEARVIMSTEEQKWPLFEEMNWKFQQM